VHPRTVSPGAIGSCLKVKGLHDGDRAQGLVAAVSRRAILGSAEATGLDCSGALGLRAADTDHARAQVGGLPKACSD